MCIYLNGSIGPEIVCRSRSRPRARIRSSKVESTGQRNDALSYSLLYSLLAISAFTEGNWTFLRLLRWCQHEATGKPCRCSSI